MEAVVMEGASVVYEGERVPAVHDMDLAVAPGEAVTIIGPNGAGKTTLLEAINGLLPPTGGRITVLGRDVTREGRAVRVRTGYVVQNFALDPLDPFLTRDVVMMGRVGRIGPLRWPRRSDWRVVDEALEAVGMTRFARRPVGKLSGGEFQKVLLARAIAQDPDLLLLDEPLANLDVDARAEVLSILEAWRARRQLTVVMVSHDLGRVPPWCDRIVVLEAGRKVLEGPREEVLSSGELGRLFGTWDTGGGGR